MSSYASEGANFGMFIGSYDIMRKAALRIRKAALDLEAHISRPSNITRVVESHCSIVISRFIKF
jgi:hypothetical protein